MKLSTFARRAGICYKTAWRWWKAGKVKGYQVKTGTVVITEEISEQPGQERVVVVYARVSANENRPNLDSQAERLCAYCAAKDWKVVKEVGSGVNEGRRNLLALLADPTVPVIVVEHKDRLTRFGFKYIETLLAMQVFFLMVLTPPRTRLKISLLMLSASSIPFAQDFTGNVGPSVRPRRLCKI